MSVIDSSVVRKIKNAILSCLHEDEHGRVRISDAVRRQNEIRLVVDNFDVLNVSVLMRKFPRKTQIFCRAVPRATSDVVLSRIEIYYFVESFWWRIKWVLMFLIWVLAPVALAFASFVF